MSVDSYEVDVRSSVQRVARAHERLKPLVEKMIADFSSSVILIRALIHAYYNIRYITRDRELVETLEALKHEGVLYREVFKALEEIYAEIKRSVRELRLLQDMCPDHLVNDKREIIWVAERPDRHPPRRSQEQEPMAEVAE